VPYQATFAQRVMRRSRSLQLALAQLAGGEQVPGRIYKRLLPLARAEVAKYPAVCAER
jgi:hypothetical protein